MHRRNFLIIAVVFHAFYIRSIFDIYFVSPLIHGMQHHSVDGPAPAQRVVLVVGDGLRADKCFQKHKDPETGEFRHLAPYIRSKVLNEGTFGVSHTRVPTESRPGHVALIAGFYEDVSAVTKGWKLNPVNFDSVFNQSRHTWSFGSPDILPMFSEGASESDRVDTFMYGEEAEDFSKDATLLDTWVFKQVTDLFRNATQNPALKTALHQDKIVFFLHLLGLDTSGHAYRPYSNEYLRNIAVVDAGVKEMVDLFNDFYGDEKTAWVFTADHGMSDWGSHGDGHPDNTRTPLVAWGSGIAKPDKDNLTGHDSFSADWDLHSVKRVDVEQAAIASLMSYLAGINFPANSVGQLPLEFLDAPDEVKAKAALTNTLGIIEQYRVKEEEKRDTEIRFRPFTPFSISEDYLDQSTDKIENLISREEHIQAIQQCDLLMQEALAGLRYLQTYDWLFLRSIITAGYVGWMLFAMVHVLENYVLPRKPRSAGSITVTATMATIIVIIYGVLLLQSAPLAYYAYVLFPAIFWHRILNSTHIIRAGVMRLSAKTSTSKTSLIAQVILYFAFLEIMVIGYFRREIFTGCFLAATIWPFYIGQSFVSKNRGLVSLWTIASVLMSTFTLLPVVKKESVFQILAGGFFMVVVGVAYILNDRREPATASSPDSRAMEYKSKLVIGAQLGLVVLSLIVTQSSVRSLQAKKGLPFGNEVTGWLTLVLSFLVPLLHLLYKNSQYVHRLVVLFLTFAPTFVILTISYEALFFVIFNITLLLWIEMEVKADEFQNPESDKTSQNMRSLRLSDARVALFSFFIVQFAFFGTGNIASVSSFSLDSVYRLIPVFNPFSQTALLILKILIPFAAVSANLGILNQRLGVPPSSLFMLVLTTSDVLTLNFFYLVRDEGSWLDIGTSISHFCISSLLCVFTILLESLSENLVSGVEVGSLEILGRVKLMNDRKME